jgi:hypothetical protein
MSEFVDWVSKNWVVLSSAPWVFATLAVFFAGIGYAVGTWFKNGEISILERRLAEYQGQVSEYKDKLKVGSPDEAMMKLAELEQYAPRRLRPEQREAILKAFKPQYSYRWSIQIYYYRACYDCSDYGRQLRDVLQTSQSGNVGLADFAGTDFGDKFGLFLGIADPNQPPPIALLLGKALNAAKVEYAYAKTPFGTSGKDVDLLILPAH